ncbi:hypothetical protein CDD83_7336 [Cordyceps sp. RAO-2017]|nr:hypothetical protein CDD83_7336 [Cordyceps sp. RAO-2017]
MGDTAYAAPVVASRFAHKIHPAHDALYEYSKRSCARSLDELAAGEEVSHNGAFAACGGSYVACVYPDGELERLKVVADCYSAWVFIDDLIDNTTDMAYVSDMVTSLRRRVAGAGAGAGVGPDDDEDDGFDWMLRLFRHAAWHPKALRLTRAEIDRFLECTVVLRAIESAARPVSVDEYLRLRAANSAMGVMYAVMAFAAPRLADELLRLSAAAPEALRRVFTCSGVSIGILLDLYKVNGEHPQRCDYTNVARILRRSARLTLPQAVDAAVDLFHQYEARLALALDEVAAASPALARAMERLHAGSVVWLAAMRGGRYVRTVDCDRDSC